MVIERPNIRIEHSNLRFLPTDNSVINLPRSEVEENLFELVQAVIERMPTGNTGAHLCDAWNRVLDSLRNDDEREYCKAAGRLGVDPYDPEIDDISEFAAHLSGRLFSDICEAATPSELKDATDWPETAHANLAISPN